VFAAEKLVDPDDPSLDPWEERMLDAIDAHVMLWPATRRTRS